MIEFESEDRDTQSAVMRWALKEAAVIFSEDAQLLAGQLESQRGIFLTAPQALRYFANSALRKGDNLNDLSLGFAVRHAASLLSRQP